MVNEANQRLVSHIETHCGKRQHVQSTKHGCGLRYLVPTIKEHYSDEKKRYNKLPSRLIGDQAISLARYGYRLVDGLESDESQHLRTLVLGRIILYLRNACRLFNKVSTTRAELLKLKEWCELYFHFSAVM